MSPYHRYARLGREGDLLPWRGRLFGRGSDHDGFEVVDPRDTHTAALIADGSIVLEDPPSPDPALAAPLELSAVAASEDRPIN